MSYSGFAEGRRKLEEKVERLGGSGDFERTGWEMKEHWGGK